MIARLARLSAFVCFLWIVGWNALATTSITAHAQAIGTHLGQGDISAQVELLDFLATKVTNTKNFPVTVMLELGAPNGDVTRLADTVKKYGFPVIVRINLVCQANRAGSSASFASTVRAAFGPEAAIVWGNEINNETECANLSTFASSFTAARGVGGRIGPATLDFYHPNSAVKLLSESPLSGVYGGAPIYFANAYGCQGGTKDSCDVASTDTQNQAIVDPKSRGPFFLTEFSLSPGPKDDSAPDADLKKVVEFIETRSAETGALGVTPLIRNVCSDDGDWLLFVSKTQSKSGKSEVYTFRKAKVDIESCSTTGKDPYYLYPIPALFDTNANPDEQKQSLISQLKDQGYQAQCLSPAVDLKAVVDGLARSELYNDVPANTKLSTETDLSVNFESSKVPGWRLDGEHDLSIINSLETVFGFRTKESASKKSNSLNDGIVYRSLGLVDQCIAQSRILDTVRTMCDKLQKPDACALNQKITDSEYDLFTLQAEMNTRIAQQTSQGTLIPDREKAREAACRQIVQTRQSNSSPTFSKTPEGLFQTALQNTPLFLSKAYRLGFLVVVAELEGTEPLSDFQPFRFLRKNEQTALPKHEIRVFTFKIPDTGTNKDTNSDIYYQDPTELTRNSNLSKEQQDVIEQNYRTLLSAENEYSDASMMPIICDADGSSYCRLPGVQALVEYVNKYLRPQSLVKPPYLDESIFYDDPSLKAEKKGLINEDALSQLLLNPDFSRECGVSADALPYQDITTIFSSGAISEESDGQIFAGENDLYAGAQKAGISQSFPTEDAPAFGFLSEAKARKDNEAVQATSGKDIKIYSYLIVPQGYQLGVTEDTLAGRFLTQKQKKTLFDSLVPDPIAPDPDKQISKYFSIQGITSTLEDVIKQSWTVVDPLSCTQVTVPSTNTTQTGNASTTNPAISPEALALLSLDLSGDGTAKPTTQNTPTTTAQPANQTTTQTNCSNITIAIKHGLANAGFMPRIHGGVLGEVMLNVQKSVLAYDSQDWKYINSCKTVEEWILGTCAGPLEESGAPTAIANLDNLKSEAVCDGGSRITSGETARHFIRLGNNPNQCYAFVSGNYSSYARPVGSSSSGGSQSTSQLGALNETSQNSGTYSHYIERWRDPTDIPFGDASTFCRTLYSYAACTFNPKDGNETAERGGVLLANKVNENGQWNSEGTMTACEYVVKKAAAAKVSPRFAIAIWGEESGFSAYRDAYAFGVTSQPPLDLEKQVSVFLNTVTNETYQQNPGHESGPNSTHGDAAPYLNFLERYSGEEKGSNSFCTNKFFPGQVKTYYDYLSEDSLRSRL